MRSVRVIQSDRVLLMPDVVLTNNADLICPPPGSIHPGVGSASLGRLAGVINHQKMQVVFDEWGVPEFREIVRS